MLKYSKQRESILKNLRKRCDHPTAEMVYESLKPANPSLSLGTVYRNLSLMSENGQILRFSAGIGPDRFDAMTHPHAHFICQKCGSVIDMDFVLSNDVLKSASSSFAGIIEDANLQFKGTCSDCLGKNIKNHN
ncbi:MAG: transcriptional repressor [Bacillota bacterium]|nr:transcriptional repressor [Bacillota bacterium]